MIPDLDIAKKLINNVCKITDELNVKMGLSRGISRIHYKNVAFCAQKIAKKCGMDYQKAYILGLLHDYGEYIEDTVEGTFHGTAGYDEMLKMGYNDVARICLTHSFWEGIYDPKYFTYHSSEIIRAKEIISDLYLKAIYEGRIEGEIPAGEEKPWVIKFPIERNNLILNDDTMYRTYMRESESRLDKIAIVEMDGTTYTHNQLRQKINDMAKGLLAKGLKTGSKIAVLTTNSVEQATTVLAANAIGATSKMVNYWDTPDAIKKSIAETDIEMIIIDEELISSGLDISAINPDDLPVVVVNAKKEYDDEEIITYNQLIEEGKNQELIIAEKDSNRPALIITSSGSTGAPKPILHTDATINAAIQGFIHSDWPFDEENAVLQTVPGFIGSLGTISSLYLSLVTGSPLILVEGTALEKMAENTSDVMIKFKELKEIANLPEELGLVVLTAPGFIRILKDRYDEIDELSYIKGILTTGSKFPKEEADELVELLMKKGLTCGICSVYGQNEMAGLVTVTTPKYNETGSVGYPAIGRTVVVVNPDTLEKLDVEKEGLILEHSPSFTIGYEGMPEKTKGICIYYKDGEFSLTDNGGIVFFITGDIGRVNSEGSFNITDRMSRTLIRGDCKFALSEIENEIQRKVPGVKECAMVSLADESDTNHYGVAFVTLTKEALETYTLEEFNDAIKDDLQKGKLDIPAKTSPDVIIAVPQIPMMQTGKTDYKTLEAEARRIRKESENAKQYTKNFQQNNPA